MLQLEHSQLRLRISPDGLNAELTDRARHCRWLLDGGSRFVQFTGDAAPTPLPAGTARMAGDAALETEHRVGDATIRFRWALEEDHVAVSLMAENAAGLEVIDWPGAVHSEADAGTGSDEILIPQYQGILARRHGTIWRHTAVRGGHANVSMGMAGVIQTGGGLLLAPDDLLDWRLAYGENANGMHATFQATPCPVEGWREMTLRLYPCAGGVTGIARRYRRLVQQRGQWRPWSEKIAERPSLRNLFGALMTFAGYIQDDALDYVAATRALREYGFPSILVYPVRFARYTQQFTMGGGLRPIWLDDRALAEMKALGNVHLSPWVWLFEGIDDASPEMHAIFRTVPDGSFRPGWTMDGQRWVQVCTPYQIQHIKARLEGDMREMSWLHFDVNATHHNNACWSTVHALHGHRPATPREDLAANSRLLSAETLGDRIISSEGFNDAHTAVYDIGSTKVLPNTFPEIMPVPLTMLVYHDCCIHDWWEMHNYNANPGWRMGNAYGGQPFGTGRNGSGEPRLKAAQDALYGLPPNVFPFGKQYAWKDAVGGETYCFTQRLEDPGVQEALAAALPVARLHQRIGQLDLVDFAFLSEDRMVQSTTFADGTRIIANLGSRGVDLEGIGHLRAQDWREL